MAGRRAAGPGCGGPGSGSGQRHCPSVPVAAPLFSLLESQAEICRVTSGRPPLIGPGAVGRVEGGGQCPAQHTPTHPGGRCPPAPTFPGLRARTSPAPCWRPVVSLVLELGVGPGRCLRWGCRTLPLGVPASSSQEQDSEKGRRWLELYRPVALSPAAGMPRRSGRVGWLGRQAPCHSSVLSTRGHGEGRAQCEWGSRVTLRPAGRLQGQVQPDAGPRPLAAFPRSPRVGRRPPSRHWKA